MKAQDIKNIIYDELQIPQEIKLGEMKVSLCDLEKIVDKISIRVEKLVSPKVAEVNREKFNKIMVEVETEWKMGGLSDGIYADFAYETLQRYSQKD